MTLTMDDLYGDGIEGEEPHEACPECHHCLTCGDCTCDSE